MDERRAAPGARERAAKKWKPVFREKAREISESRACCDSTESQHARARRPSKRDYRLLSELRYLIRRFLEFSQAAAARAGLTARQHQALLALKGAREDSVTTVGYLAERLRVRHQSAVELADRLEEAGLIRRAPDANDRRRVRLELTDKAERRLALLSSSHIAELKRLRPALLDILDSAEKIEHGAS